MNVLIYFSEERRRELVQHFYNALEPGGYLLPRPFRIHFQNAREIQAIVLNDCILYRKPTCGEAQKAELVTEGRA
jgi:chemotaxis protein methyltransferase CheR